jgi:hypothetical protein
MKYDFKVGDLFINAKQQPILITTIIHDFVRGYWGSELRSVGYKQNIDILVQNGSWKYYPVVK